MSNTFRCTKCGCLWRLNPPSAVQPDGSWSLYNAEQKSCRICDNSPEFLSVIVPVYTEADRAADQHMKESVDGFLETYCDHWSGKPVSAPPAALSMPELPDGLLEALRAPEPHWALAKIAADHIQIVRSVCRAAQDAVLNWSERAIEAERKLAAAEQDAQNRGADLLLAELAKRGINTDNWDGDEGLWPTLARCIAQAIHQAEQRAGENERDAEAARRALDHNLAIANRAGRHAMDERDIVIRTLRKHYSAIEIAEIAGLTRQRIHQILNEPDAAIDAAQGTGKGK